MINFRAANSMVEYSAFNRFVPGSIPGQPINTIKKYHKISCKYSNQIYIVYTPRGIRIPVTSVKGRCPRPLDDGGYLNLVFCKVYIIYVPNNSRDVNYLFK